MKKIKTYKVFNESLRDKLKGKSREEILNGPSFKDKTDEEIFILSCKVGLMWLVLDMIKKGVDVTCDNMCGLYYAIRNYHLDIAEILLDKEEIIEGMDEDFTENILTKMVGKSDKVVKFIINNDVMRKHIPLEDIESLEEYLNEVNPINESLRDKIKGKSLTVVEDAVESIIEDVLNELLGRHYFDDTGYNEEKLFSILEHDYKQMIIDMVSGHGLNSEQMTEQIIMDFEECWEGLDHFKKKWAWVA
jgi:hypothetical protein